MFLEESWAWELTAGFPSSVVSSWEITPEREPFSIDLLFLSFKPLSLTKILSEKFHRDGVRQTGLGRSLAKW